MSRSENLFGLVEGAVEAAIARSGREYTESEIDTIRLRFTRIYASPKPIDMSKYKR